ncbi:hypothetical protein BCR33DRAFT_724159 [Rhizoclosmatium globosum]|uniref:Homeobox domain-containing protein n=1 Tax=Rhizoclosmatium globosum TaxID=329046 RepID=A0A1Y2B8B0_9FUNG|nr:hypothetical protein BCR33DRAFT_724159 [Rhizoclosmatium globosum]|eukprot:ORY30936.1 hypothetical protein BCR33DRAFT_724159 [Rhizoclosmatium globosum]
MTPLDTLALVACEHYTTTPTSTTASSPSPSPSPSSPLLTLDSFDSETDCEDNDDDEDEDDIEMAPVPVPVTAFSPVSLYPTIKLLNSNTATRRARSASVVVLATSPSVGTRTSGGVVPLTLPSHSHSLSPVPCQGFAPQVQLFTSSPTTTLLHQLPSQKQQPPSPVTSTTHSRRHSTASTRTSSLSPPVPNHASSKPRANFTPEVLDVLTAWLDSNRHDPYPSIDVKRLLAAECGLELKQVNNWFINARRRRI